MPLLPIARITHPVALCSPETDAAVLVARCLQADASFGVVLDAQQCPVGMVRLQRLLCLSPPTSPFAGGESGGVTESLPIRLVAAALIEPVGLLPASLSLTELCEHLASRESGHWAIVDAQGQFLGLLNSERALSWLAEQWGNAVPTAPAYPLTPWVSWPATPPDVTLPVWRSLQGTATPSASQGSGWRHPGEASQLAGTHTLPSPTVAERSALPVGWQWLDWLPLPLQLQTETGMVLGQNLVWSQVMGDRADLSPQALLFPQLGASLPGAHPCYPSPLATASRLMALRAGADRGDSWPEPSADLQASDDSVGEMSPPIPPSLGDTYAYGCILATREEKIWQLLHLSLPPMATPAAGFCPAAVWSDAGAGQTLGDGKHSARLRLLAAIEVTPIYAQSQRLTAANRDLWQQNQAKDEFLMSLSHDLKAPLTAILGLASLMQTATVGPLNARQHQYIQLIHHNARLLTTLTNHSFELACLDSGQLTLNCKPVDLKAICERAIAQAQVLHVAQASNLESPNLASAAEPSLEVDRRVIQQVWEIDVDTEYLVADELRLCQMLTHLLSNALKFSSPTDQVGVRISRWHPDWLALTVWDTGIGIPATEQPRLFQKLQQLQVAHGNYPGGVGMGLALTYRLVRLHGGVISFLSQAGVGSEFTLLLPAANPGLIQPPRSGEGDGVAPTAAMIVLVAESPSQCQGKGLIEALQALGCRVVVARFPQDLLEKAKCLHPSVIFLDESWLIDTDASLLAMLRADPDTAQLPVIATVSRSRSVPQGESTPESLLHAQVDGILSLPPPISLLQSWFEYLAMQRCGEGMGGPPPTLSPTTSPTKSLTLLSLSQLLPDSPLVGVSADALPGRLPIDLPNVFSQYQHRLLEADDLEQAALLATVWHPDLLLVRADTLADPVSYLDQIKGYPDLASRAIVILNVTDVTPCLQAVDLKVFPYQLNQTVNVAHFLTYLHRIAANHPPMTSAPPLPSEEG